MLKNAEKCDIIYSVVRWDYMNNNILISTAMLSAFWEKKQKDNLDLLIPFLKYSIAKTTNVNSAVNIAAVTNYMQKEFGYDSMPYNVIAAMLKRLSKLDVLRRKNKSYILIESLDSIVDNFDNDSLLYGEQIEKVIDALIKYAYDNDGYNWNHDSATSSLIDFFVARGICIVQDTYALNLLNKKDDKKQYCIAQFIIYARDNLPIVFGCLENMVKGFFISTVISLQPDNRDVVLSKFKKLTCFIDTSIILGALGLKTKEENEAATQMLSMLVENGCELRCFEHTVDEIKDIINAYKNRHSNPFKAVYTPTLEAWDEKKYTTTNILLFQAILESRIEKNFNMKIVYEDIGKSDNFDKEDFENFVGGKILYNNPGRLSNDADSVEAILCRRGRHSSEKIEDCGYIFITSNTRLVNATKKYFREKSNLLGNTVPPIVSDVDMSAIVWMKCYSTHKDYPKCKLIENALCASKPSAELMNAFYDCLETTKSAGKISAEEAAMIRIELFCVKEMITTVRGDKKNITEKLVLDLRDTLENHYVGEDLNGLRSEIDTLRNDIQKQKTETANKNKEVLKKISDEINNVGKRKYDKVYKTLCAGAWIVIAVLIITFGIATANTIATADMKFLWAVIVSGLFGLVGGLDMLINKMNYIKKWCRIIANNAADRDRDKKRKEYEGIIGKINS